jgi:hypothetical protein
MVHAALLLLMLEAVTTDLVFTISLKRSTQNLQLSTSWAGRLPHLLAQSGRLPSGAVFIGLLSGFVAGLRGPLYDFYDGILEIGATA